MGIIGIISGIGNIINIIVIATGSAEEPASNNQDSNPYNAIGYGISIICCVISYYGALKYNVACLGINIGFLAIWFVAAIVSTILAPGEATGAIIGTIIVLVLYTALAMYPAVFLIKEIKAGIMTEETYPREAYSCCCSPKV